MTWKYGTVLRDDQYGRIVMVTREIPKKLAGELDLYEAIIIKGPVGASPWVAVSPRQDDLTVIGEQGTGLVFTYDGAGIGSGTFTGALTFDDPPPPGSFTITVESE